MKKRVQILTTAVLAVISASSIAFADFGNHCFSISRDGQNIDWIGFYIERYDSVTNTKTYPHVEIYDLSVGKLVSQNLPSGSLFTPVLSPETNPPIPQRREGGFSVTFAYLDSANTLKTIEASVKACVSNAGGELTYHDANPATCHQPQGFGYPAIQIQSNLAIDGIQQDSSHMRIITGCFTLTIDSLANVERKLANPPPY